MAMIVMTVSKQVLLGRGREKGGGQTHGFAEAEHRISPVMRMGSG